MLSIRRAARGDAPSEIRTRNLLIPAGQEMASSHLAAGDNGGPDKPYGLRGSVAGAYMMGVGGAVRWRGAAGEAPPALSTLEARLRALVEGIAASQDNASGYIMAFPMNESHSHENPDYVTSWVTHGLLEAASGLPELSDTALRLLRDHFDWFDASDTLPLFLPPLGGAGAPFPKVRPAVP
jgi:hypothetical protein